MMTAPIGLFTVALLLVWTGVCQGEATAPGTRHRDPTSALSKTEELHRSSYAHTDDVCDITRIATDLGVDPSCLRVYCVLSPESAAITTPESPQRLVYGVAFTSLVVLPALVMYAAGLTVDTGTAPIVCSVSMADKSTAPATSVAAITKKTSPARPRRRYPMPCRPCRSQVALLRTVT